MNYYLKKKQITIAEGTKFYYSFLCSLTEKNSWNQKIGVKSFKCIEFSIFLHLKIFWNEIEGEFFFGNWNFWMKFVSTKNNTKSGPTFSFNEERDYFWSVSPSKYTYTQSRHLLVSTGDFLFDKLLRLPFPRQPWWPKFTKYTYRN